MRDNYQSLPEKPKPEDNFKLSGILVWEGYAYIQKQSLRHDQICWVWSILYAEEMCRKTLETPAM